MTALTWFLVALAALALLSTVFMLGWSLGVTLHGNRSARMERVALVHGLRRLGHKRAALAVELGEV
jgi:hypothetical protein